MAPAWSDRDLQEARLLQGKLLELFSSGLVGAESMHAVTSLCDRALVTVADNFCQEMFCEIDRQAHDLAATGGRQRHQIALALDSINERLSNLQTFRTAGEAVASAEATPSKP